MGGEQNKLEGELEDGYYVQPTVFKGNNKMRIFQEEIFGPVVSVTTFKTKEEALEIANDTLYGLGAGCLDARYEHGVPFRSRHSSRTCLDELLPRVSGTCCIRWLQSIRYRP